MSARDVWFGNTAWPSGASPGAFARDVFRLAEAKTDREKALAYTHWLIRCMNRGANLKLPSMGGYVHCADPLLLFTSWGHNECTGWGWVATEALQAAGLKARRVVVHDSGHTFYEVWYKGLDGEEGWHAFDPFLGWWYTNDRGEVASCEELTAHPDLVAHPRPGGPTRLGHHPERSGVLKRYQFHDQLDIVQPVRDERLYFQPKAGQSYSNLWRPEEPSLGIPANADGSGAHCDIALYDEEGRPRYPEHHEYWRHYVWPHRDDTFGSQVVRWHGCGALRWQPLLHGAAQAESAAFAVFEDGTLRPSGSRKHCEVWWRIQLPYLATYLRVNMAADAGGSDLIGLAISTDAGKSLHPFHWAHGAPPKLLQLLPSQTPSIRGLKEFWLRLDISSQQPQPKLRIRGLQLAVGYQLNMNVLPRLVPGANELFVEAGALDGVKLAAEWAFTHPQGERLESVALDRAGRAARKVDLDLAKPSDVVMRGVTLRCLDAR